MNKLDIEILKQGIAERMKQMENEVPYKEYCCQYKFGGSTWCLNIMAKDSGEAEARCRILGNLELLGEKMGEVLLDEEN